MCGRHRPSVNPDAWCSLGKGGQGWALASRVELCPGGWGVPQGRRLYLCKAPPFAGPFLYATFIPSFVGLRRLRCPARAKHRNAKISERWSLPLRSSLGWARTVTPAVCRVESAEASCGCAQERGRGRAERGGSRGGSRGQRPLSRVWQKWQRSPGRHGKGQGCRKGTFAKTAVRELIPFPGVPGSTGHTPRVKALLNKQNANNPSPRPGVARFLGGARWRWGQTSTKVLGAPRV